MREEHESPVFGLKLRKIPKGGIAGWIETFSEPAYRPRSAGKTAVGMIRHSARAERLRRGAQFASGRKTRVLLCHHRII